jgi:hypothetical protein
MQPSYGSTAVKRYLKHAVQGALAPVEERLLRGVAPAGHAPMLIVGPPRSGSTLLYQLLARRYRVCYFSNLMMRFPRTPVCLAAMTARWGGCNPPDDYCNRYGETRGWSAPNQGRAFWNEYLPPFPHEIAPEEVSQEVKERLSTIIGALQGLADAPFINKWPPNGLRMRLLAEILPQAVFVTVTRERDAMIASILRARAEICRRGSGWFSVKPAGYQERLSDEPAAQVRWQLDRIQEAIDRDRAAIGAQKFMTVPLEALIARPREILDDIGLFYRNNTGMELDVRNEVPFRL